MKTTGGLILILVLGLGWLPSIHAERVYRSPFAHGVRRIQALRVHSDTDRTDYLDAHGIRQYLDSARGPSLRRYYQEASMGILDLVSQPEVPDFHFQGTGEEFLKHEDSFLDQFNHWIGEQDEQYRAEQVGTPPVIHIYVMFCPQEWGDRHGVHGTAQMPELDHLNSPGHQAYVIWMYRPDLGTLVHEVGHVLGLYHSRYQGDIDPKETGDGLHEYGDHYSVMGGYHTFHQYYFSIAIRSFNPSQLLRLNWLPKPDYVEIKFRSGPNPAWTYLSAGMTIETHPETEMERAHTLVKLPPLSEGKPSSILIWDTPEGTYTMAFVHRYQLGGDYLAPRVALHYSSLEKPGPTTWIGDLRLPGVRYGEGDRVYISMKHPSAPSWNVVFGFLEIVDGAALVRIGHPELEVELVQA